jgi:hypothetical protein
MTTPTDNAAALVLLILWLAFFAWIGGRAVRGVARWLHERDDHA